MRIKLRAVLATALIGVVAAPTVAQDIPRAASTPQTAKNWRGPTGKIKAQALVDKLIAGHKEIMSITMHAQPDGLTGDAYTMIAGSFPDRIGNTSSPGDIITAKKGVTQVESKWGTPDYGKKVSIVIPLKDSAGKYLPVAMVIAFHQSPATRKKDTDFMQPGIAIRDGLSRQIPNLASLYAPAG
ncbi:MAG: hypothetical protein JWN21_340 [Sphingomonas bacterium]|uniref:hypothetical protein n=1 Tax=Sphingomonas bacterium TaxID=1895847 RepID=UPI0026283653|nr:hypothetical protein [Sphingomonas bacterium]MDB5694797.1 hypothetical protein [Sphingomonas bacterium]